MVPHLSSWACCHAKSLLAGAGSCGQPAEDDLSRLFRITGVIGESHVIGTFSVYHENKNLAQAAWEAMLVALCAIVKSACTYPPQDGIHQQRPRYQITMYKFIKCVIHKFNLHIRDPGEAALVIFGEHIYSPAFS